MSYDEWKLEDYLCRCCHSEGSFKNLSKGFNFGNEEEIYVDMLKYTLDIHIAPVLGALCTATYTICEPCILKLQEATTFKKQVLRCEEKFRDMYTRNFIKVAAPSDLEIKDEPPEENDDTQQDIPYMDSDEFHIKDDEHDKEDEEEELITKKVKHEGKKRSKKMPSKSKSQPKPKKPPKRGRPRKGDEVVANEKAEGDKKTRVHYYRIVNGKHVCNVCDSAFASQPLVSQHYRFVHLKRRPRERKCPSCDKRIPSYLRAYHLEEEHGVPAPRCGVCSKKFRYPCQMLEHQRKVHLGEKHFVCDVCQKGFFNGLSLRLHMVTHSSERRYKCDVCTREFRWENNLKDHMKIHAGDKRYVCLVCEKAFVQKSTLKQHCVRNHPGFDVP